MTDKQTPHAIFTRLIKEAEQTWREALREAAGRGSVPPHHVHFDKRIECAQPAMQTLRASLEDTFPNAQRQGRILSTTTLTHLVAVYVYEPSHRGRQRLVSRVIAQFKKRGGAPALPWDCFTDAQKEYLSRSGLTEQQTGVKQCQKSLSTT